MNQEQIIALEKILEASKNLVKVATYKGEPVVEVLREEVRLVEGWLYENYCKDCKNQIRNLETGEDTICACDVPF